MHSHSKFTRGEGLLEGFLSKQRAKMANHLIPDSLRSGRILDIGSGSFPYFLVNTEFNEKYGIDPVVDSKLGKKLGINLFQQGITEKKLQFEDNFFDVVTMLAVFEHIDEEKINNLLKETRRILKKGGLLIMTTPAPWSDLVLKNMARIGLVSKEEIHEHKTHYNKDSIEKLIKKAEFNFVKSGYFELIFNMWFLGKK